MILMFSFGIETPEQKKDNKIISLIQKMNPNVLKNISRPKDIPFSAHDCGWNHAKPKEK